jgi:hypothetical protein
MFGAHDIIKKNINTMKRSYTVTDILNKRYKTFPFDGAWAEAFSQPERRGRWFIWGNSGNGKTSFVMQLCKKLSQYDTVLYVSLEEGASMTVQKNFTRYKMHECGNRFALVVESMEELKERLRKKKSPSIVVIDSLQYTQMNYTDYIHLKEEFTSKLIILISHARGRLPAGESAQRIQYDADLKIWVEGYKAFSKGRYIGSKGEFVVWKEGAEKYWGESGSLRSKSQVAPLQE